LRLLERFDGKALDTAIAAAIERGAIGLPSIEHLLEQQRRKHKLAPAIAPTVLLNERAAALRTVSQPLAGYDALGRDEDDHDF
jgi:hypothetical protein